VPKENHKGREQNENVWKEENEVQREDKHLLKQEE
jgi:hypothetical protein